MLTPTGRVVLISGATRGIGRAVLDRLLSAGCQVCAGARDPARLPSQPGLSAARYDAAEPGSAAAWVDAAVKRHGRIDAVVNAAGVNPRGTLLDDSDEPFTSSWTVNTMGPMRVIRAAWPHLVRSGTGRVVTIASLSGKRVRNDNLAYALSKHAVMALTHEVRRLGWEHGIRATTVCPGFVDTDMTAHVTQVPRAEMTQPDDVAALVEMALHLPGTANVAELLVNWRHEDFF